MSDIFFKIWIVSIANFYTNTIELRVLGVSSINNLKILFLKVLNRLNVFHDIQKVDDLFWHISKDSANFLKRPFVQTQAVLHEHRSETL